MSEQLPIKAIQYAYNSGYNAGHHDTVEGNASPLKHNELTREREDQAQELAEQMRRDGLLGVAAGQRVVVTQELYEALDMLVRAEDLWLPKNVEPEHEHEAHVLYELRDKARCALAKASSEHGSES